MFIQQTLYGNEYCDFKEVQIFLVNFIPDTELDYTLGDLAVFIIKHQNQAELMDLLENLTRYKEELNVNSFKLQECSLDIILYNLFSRDQSSFQFGDSESQMFTINREPRRRYIIALFLNIWEVLRQRMLRDIRNCFIPLLKLKMMKILSTQYSIWIPKTWSIKPSFWVFTTRK